MTHQVNFLSEALRTRTAEAVTPLSLETRNAAAQVGAPVALSVALRYLASRRMLLRAAAETPDHD